MKRIIITLLGLAMLAFVGACGSIESLPKAADVAQQAPKKDNPDTSYAPEAPAGATEEPDDPTNERGNIEFALGDTMGLTGPSGDVIAEVTVTGLEFITCQSVMSGTSNPLLMSYTIETSEDAARSDLGSVFNPFAMTLYDASTGVTSTNTGVPVCAQKSNELHVPVSLSPGSKYTGGMLFEDAPESGAVIYTPSWSNNGAEWAY